ncbi:H+-ATPase G subunit-domain-containing protein [Kalaharituber pfeilii]|nr:H+-ATPase G subunit-domain-containing protein [Kalaharituber pfeilii]
MRSGLEKYGLEISAQNSAGIQTLLDAEREAQKIVQKARQYRTQRVKDARAEAAKEIEEYKQQKEAEFKKFEAEHSGSNAKAEDAAAREAEGALARIKKAGEQHGERVIQDLIKGVTEGYGGLTPALLGSEQIHPEPHRNLKAASTA